MRNQHHRPTKTRAAIDRFLHDLYYQLYHGARPNISAILEHHHLSFSIIQDLRQLGVLESVGTSRGQKHRWVGPYPCQKLGDQVERIRRERHEQRQQQQHQENLTKEEKMDQLLDQRNRIDRELRHLGGQSRLF